MEINIQATIGICTEFKASEEAEKAEVSVVISPLKVTTEESSSKLQIISGCNLWQSCHNIDCWYSIASRRIKKA